MLRSLDSISSSFQRKNALLGTKFPLKLWTIINDSSTDAIRWGPKGQTIVLEYESFQKEFLNDEVGIFKTNNITSFVRQLNLYGFRKIYRSTKSGNDETHEFQHPLFLRERRDLISQIRRKTGARSSKIHNEIVPPIPTENQRMPTQVQKYHAAFQKALNRQKNIRDENRSRMQQKIAMPQYPNALAWDMMMNKMLWNYPPMIAAPYGPGPFPGPANDWARAESEYYNPQGGRGDYLGAHNYDKQFGFENTSKFDSATEGAASGSEMMPNANNFYFLLMSDQGMPGHGMYQAGGYYDGTVPIAGMPMAQNSAKGGNEEASSGENHADGSENDNIFANLGYLT